MEELPLRGNTASMEKLQHYIAMLIDDTRSVEDAYRTINFVFTSLTQDMSVSAWDVETLLRDLQFHVPGALQPETDPAEETSLFLIDGDTYAARAEGDEVLDIDLLQNWARKVLASVGKALPDDSGSDEFDLDAEMEFLEFLATTDTGEGDSDLGTNLLDLGADDSSPYVEAADSNREFFEEREEELEEVGDGDGLLEDTFTSPEEIRGEEEDSNANRDTSHHRRPPRLHMGEHRHVPLNTLRGLLVITTDNNLASSAWRFRSAADMLEALNAWDQEASRTRNNFTALPTGAKEAIRAGSYSITSESFTGALKYTHEDNALSLVLKLHNNFLLPSKKILQGLKSSVRKNGKCYFVQFLDRIVLSETKEFELLLGNSLVRLASHGPQSGDTDLLPTLSTKEVGTIERVWALGRGKDYFRVTRRNVPGWNSDDYHMEKFIQETMQEVDGRVRKVVFQ